MNGVDWPSPAAILPSVESEIKSILAAVGVDVPNFSAGIFFFKKFFSQCSSCSLLVHYSTIFLFVFFCLHCDNQSTALLSWNHNSITNGFKLEYGHWT